MSKMRVIPLRQMTETELRSEIRRLERAIGHKAALFNRNRASGERERIQKNRVKNITKMNQRLQLAQSYLKESK